MCHNWWCIPHFRTHAKYPIVGDISRCWFSKLFLSFIIPYLSSWLFLLYIAAMILPVYPTKNPMQIHHELPKEIRPGHGVHSCPALLWTRKPWAAALQLPRELKIWCPCAFHVHFSKKLGKMISQLMAMFDYVHRGRWVSKASNLRGDLIVRQTHLVNFHVNPLI